MCLHWEHKHKDGMIWISFCGFPFFGPVTDVTIRDLNIDFRMFDVFTSNSGTFALDILSKTTELNSHNHTK